MLCRGGLHNVNHVHIVGNEELHKACAKGIQNEVIRHEDYQHGKAHAHGVNDEEKLSAEGSCQLISADSSSERYALLGQVEITSFEENLTLHTQSLSWDGKTQQLVTDVQDTLELKKGTAQEAAPSTSIELTGSGFSASGVTGNFQFTGAVSGKIYTATAKGEAP